MTTRSSRARGVADLVSALAKLAVPEGSHLLRAGAASLLSHRVARLTTSEPRRTHRVADWLLIAVFVGNFSGVRPRNDRALPELLQSQHLIRGTLSRSASRSKSGLFICHKPKSSIPC